MTYLLSVLAVLFVLDGLRLRRRAGALDVLGPAETAEMLPTYEMVTAPGITVDQATERSAAAFAGERGLDLLDLVPAGISLNHAMTLVQLVDPSTYGADRLRPGYTVGHAILITADVVERTAITVPADDLEFARLAVRLKPYGKAGLAIAPGTPARPGKIDQRFDVLRTMLGPATAPAIGALPVLGIVVGVGTWLAPIAGLAAIAAWHLQPLLVFAGTHLRPRRLLVSSLLRFPTELLLAFGAVFARRRRQLGKHPTPTEQLFEPRRSTCPMCDAPDPVLHLRSPDRIKHKPGRFTLERCQSCRHIFQNPRLSVAGLDYYYRDFYDGLGESDMELVFSAAVRSYRDRARMVKHHTMPARWLDVGAGHGHFCIAARDEFPDTRFDGLDLSESIDEAKRRGWVDTAYRGLFADLASTFAGRYDAVSMSHYLEHTTDPRAEIGAARTALEPGGYLLIEVPDPDFVLGRVLRSYWLPWFQPQHLHLLPAAKLGSMLAECGFVPLTWHRGAAHQPVDLFFVVYLFLDRLAPPTDLPWRPRRWLAAARFRRTLVWTLGMPFLLAAGLTDLLLAPLIARARVGNTYRVVARKED